VTCYIWYSEEEPGQAGTPPSPLLAVPNVTAHLSAASVPITVLLYDGPLLCGFNVMIKGISISRKRAVRDCAVLLFVRLSPETRAGGRERPQRCWATWTTGVPDVFFAVKNFNPREIYA